MTKKISKQIPLRLTDDDLRRIVDYQEIWDIKTITGAVREIVQKHAVLAQECDDLAKANQELEYKNRELEEMLEGVRTQCALILDKTSHTSLV